MPPRRFRRLAVEVEALEEDDSAHEHLNKAWEEQQNPKSQIPNPKSQAAPEIIRLYATDKDRYVRDTRTDARTTQVNEVFEGDLDAFILAYLKTEEAAAAWNEV